MYSCPKLDKIYLLIRGANGKSANERLEEMIGQKPFGMRLKQDFIRQKLIAIESDISEPNLGLIPSDIALLNDKIALIFHVAASIKFDAPVEINIKHNVVATKQLLELACQFKKLQCFIHVSTAYSNCQLREIDERIYRMEVPDDPTELVVTKEMIDSRPNTYTFTKAMAENVVSKYANSFNTVIVRPSIVMSALKEPAEGWVDSINGPVGLSVLGALGILQKIKVNSEVVFDLVPVDVVSNALVSIGWAAVERRQEFYCSSSSAQVDQLATNNNMININNNIGSNMDISQSIKPSSKTIGCEKNLIGNNLNNNNNTTTSTIESSNDVDNVPVFNLTTGSENPCSFYHYFNTGREEAHKKPSARALRPLLTIPKQKGMNPIQYWIYKVFSHLLFAYMIDSLLGLFGQKRMVIKAVRRMHHANEMFDYFCSNQWHFVTDNVKRLRDIQSPLDRETFNCDVRAIDWSYYAKLGWLGCRRFILKEDDDTFDYAKRRYRAICFIYYMMKIILLLSFTSLAKIYLGSGLAIWMLLMPIYGIVYLL